MIYAKLTMYFTFYQSHVYHKFLHIENSPAAQAAQRHLAPKEYCGGISFERLEVQSFWWIFSGGS